MYKIVRILIPIICIAGILYITMVKNKYKKDTSSSKEEIIKYFKNKNAYNLENGIKIKDLPKDISKNPYLLMMVQDKTLSFKKGKYYLNK